MNKFLQLAAATAAVASVFSATAAEIGTEVQLSETLMGRVMNVVSGTNNYVEVYANPNNKPSGVYEIKYSYFQGDDVFIPQAVATDGFKTCELQYVNFPSSMTAIGANAFYGCTKLQGFNEAERGSIKSVAASAFDMCLHLTTIKLPGVETIGNFAFRGTALTEVDLPAVKTIGGGAFQDCKSLTTARLGDNLTSIGNIAFSNCEALTGVRLPHGLKTIGNMAFSFTTALSEVVIPTGVSEIGNQAFYGSGLKRVFILPLNFMNYCDASCILDNEAITEIYVTRTLVEPVEEYQKNGSADKKPETLTQAPVKTMDDVLFVDKIDAAQTMFRLTPRIEKITDIHVYTSLNGSEIVPTDGVYSFGATNALFTYYVDDINYLSYFAHDLGYSCIEDIETGNAAISINDGVVSVDGAKSVSIYDLQGRRLDSSNALPAGMYIVVADGHSNKIMVK